MLNVISLGAGVQSSTLALMAAAGEVTPMPDCAIFADTHHEPRAVYEWLQFLTPRMPFPVYRVSKGAEQRAKVVTAEAEASAIKVRADGDAYSTITNAKANAQALQSKDILELKRIEVQLAQAQKWDGTLPTAIYAGAPIPFLNVK